MTVFLFHKCIKTFPNLDFFIVQSDDLYTWKEEFMEFMESG
jgi:hypothetical protein